MDAPEFVPKSSTVNQQQLPPQLVQQQQIPLQHHQAAYGRGKVQNDLKGSFINYVMQKSLLFYLLLSL